MKSLRREILVVTVESVSATAVLLLVIHLILKYVIRVH
jgi:hypothetical protein